MILAMLATAATFITAVVSPVDGARVSESSTISSIGGDYQDQESSPPGASQLPDVVVKARPAEEEARRFIGEIAAPSRGESLARWRGSICIGAAGFDAEGGRFIVDRVSSVAAGLGLRPEEPGCEPDVLILATSDGSRTARATVDLERSRFLPGGMGFSRTRGDLARFVETNRAVRWWHTTIPIDTRIDRRARRLPTDATEDDVLPDERLDNVPQIQVPATLIGSTTRQDMWAATIIVDFSRLGAVDYDQLADYIAFVALAQVDPEADTAGFPTVLNVFDDPAAAAGLTDWDRAYLHGLYESDEAVRGPVSREAEIRREMLRARARAQEAPAD